MSARTSHPGFDALVTDVVEELDRHGLTLSAELVRDELRLLLRTPVEAGGLRGGDPLDLLGRDARRRIADRLRRRLHLPDLAPTSPECTTPEPEPSDGTDGAPDREPCPVVDLAPRRRG